MHGPMNVKFSMCYEFSTSVFCTVTKEPTTKRKKVKCFGHTLRGNCLLYHIIVGNIYGANGKGKVIPLQARCGPEGG